MPCTDSCPAPRLPSAVALCGVLGRGPGEGHAPCRLTQELLQHLAVVKVLLQLLHDDSLLHQDVVDPVSEHLGETQASQPRPPRQGTRAGVGTKLPAARGPGQAGPEGQASPSPPTRARASCGNSCYPQQRFSHCLDWASPWRELREAGELSARGSGGAWWGVQGATVGSTVHHGPRQYRSACPLASHDLHQNSPGSP